MNFFSDTTALGTLNVIYYVVSITHLPFFKFIFLLLCEQSCITFPWDLTILLPSGQGFVGWFSGPCISQ